MSRNTRIIAILVLTVTFALAMNDTRSEEYEALNSKQRTLIPIAAFTASGDMQRLESALGEGLDAGLTVNEIKEVLVHTYAYAGFPRALNGIMACMAVLEKRKENGITDATGQDATPVPDDFDTNAYGHRTRNELVGRDMSNPTSGYAAFAPIIDQFLVEHLFADIFYRDVLTHHERELATISILAVMEGTEAQLKSHLGVSMNVGLSKAQLKDFVAVLTEKVSGGSAERAHKMLSEILGIDPPVKQAQPIEVIRKGATTKGPKEHFSGHVTVESRFSSPTPDSFGGGIVNFEAGARTAWHTHPLGQTLIVISGRGLVQSKGEAVQEILPGDVVQIPPNQRHWHGAAADSPMSHVAISAPRNGSTVEWMEHVNP